MATRGTTHASTSVEVKTGWHSTINHDSIREWAEKRGGKPSRFIGTGGKGDIGELGILFPGSEEEQELQPITWECGCRIKIVPKLPV